MIHQRTFKVPAFVGNILGSLVFNHRCGVSADYKKGDHEMRNRGKLYLFEGVDYSGKTSLIHSLLNETDLSEQIGEIHAISEPSKDNEIRSILMNDNKLSEFAGQDLTTNPKLQSLFRYHLFMASRAVSMNRAFYLMQQGINVLLDRSFISTWVYQNDIESPRGPFSILYTNIQQYKFLSSQYFKKAITSPDVLFLLDINWETYVSRSRKKGQITSFDSVDESVVTNRMAMYKEAVSELEEINDLGIIDMNISNVDANKDLEQLVQEVYSRIVKLNTGSE